MAINETIFDDMNTLPANVSAALTGEKFGQCVDKVGSLGGVIEKWV